MHSERPSQEEDPEAKLLATLATQAPFSFPSLVVPLPDTPQAILVVLSPGRKAVPTSTLADAIQHFEGKGFIPFPALLTPKAWQALQEATPAPLPHATAPISFSPDRTRLTKLLQKNLETFSTGVGSKLPAHIVLPLVADLLRDGLTILFRLHGCDASDESLLEQGRPLVQQLSCPPILDTYLAIRGAALAATLLHRSLLSPEVFVPDMEPVRQFLLWLEEHAIEQTTSTSERRRRRISLRVLGLSPLVALILGGVWYVIHTWPEQPVAAPADTDVGGIVGQYFTGKGFKSKRFERVDRRIAFAAERDFGSDVPRDHFSVRWEGLLQFTQDGAHSLCVASDDGNRLRFNGRLLIDDWKVHPKTQTCKTVYVRQGWYPIQLDYFEEGGSAAVKLLSGPSSSEPQTVSSSNLCCRHSRGTP
jgi:hypothetical protein